MVQPSKRVKHAGPPSLRANMPQKPRYDWVAIKKEYRTATYSDAELARRHGCSRRAIQKRVEKEGWTRDLAGAVRQTFTAKMVAEDARVARKVADDNAKSDESEVDRAAEVRLDVVLLHRSDIKALREEEQRLLAELGDSPTKLWVGQYQGQVIEHKVGIAVTERASALQALAAVQHKRIQLERQAFHIEDRPVEITGKDGGPIKHEIVSFPPVFASIDDWIAWQQRNKSRGEV